MILTLLALPLLYNRGFFWGFIHFNLGLGIAFIVLSQLVGPWSKKKGWRIAGLCLLSAVTHVYGLVLLSSYALAWFVAGERRQLLSRIVWVLPALLALGCWAIFAANAPGYGITEWAPFDFRLKQLGNSILGGYKDSSEDFILCGWVVVAAVLAAHEFPITWRRWMNLGVHSRAAYILIVVHIVAYFVVPVATPTAKFINFRHAMMAAMLVPLLVTNYEYLRVREVASSMLVVLAAVALGNTWRHLWQFEREASDFDTIVAAVPARAHLAQLTYESKGAIMRSHAYLHFGAYAQAQKGGVFAVSFPILFWNIPLKGRRNSDMPDTPKNMEVGTRSFQRVSNGALLR